MLVIIRTRKQMKLRIELQEFVGTASAISLLFRESVKDVPTVVGRATHRFVAGL